MAGSARWVVVLGVLGVVFGILGAPSWLAPSWLASTCSAAVMTAGEVHGMTGAARPWEMPSESPGEAPESDVPFLPEWGTAVWGVAGDAGGGGSNFGNSGSSSGTAGASSSAALGVTSICVVRSDMSGRIWAARQLSYRSPPRPSMLDPPRS